jgi:hypothetical protein
MTENQMEIGQTYSHVGERVTVLSLHSDQACVRGEDGALRYIPYSELKKIVEKKP